MYRAPLEEYLGSQLYAAPPPTTTPTAASRLGIGMDHYTPQASGSSTEGGSGSTGRLGKSIDMYINRLRIKCAKGSANDCTAQPRSTLPPAGGSAGLQPAHRHLRVGLVQSRARTEGIFPTVDSRPRLTATAPARAVFTLRLVSTGYCLALTFLLMLIVQSQLGIASDILPANATLMLCLLSFGVFQICSCIKCTEVLSQ